ncbi:MAG TPA: prepilin-type N-terminal cleavage/methylation domain-containing protein, partial [Plasticicumulans sp.]|nr:prepilin-type N-terminal cleavage/methylation domain-containing protein [Plasticicumulans sp.]
MSTEARRPAAGYTLLEVMVVVTIIGLLSALGGVLVGLSAH